MRPTSEQGSGCIRSIWGEVKGWVGEWMSSPKTLTLGGVGRAMCASAGWRRGGWSDSASAHHLHLTGHARSPLWTLFQNVKDPGLQKKDEIGH